MGWGDVFGDLWGGVKEIAGLATGDTSFSDLADNFAHNWDELVSGDEDSSLYQTFANPSDPFTALVSSLGQATYLTGKGVFDAFDFTGDALGDVGKTVTGGVFDDRVYDIGGDLVAGGLTSPKNLKGLLNLTDNLRVVPSSTAIRQGVNIAKQPAASTFNLKSIYPTPSNLMGMNAPFKFKYGNFKIPNNKFTRAFTTDSYKYGFPRTGKYSQYIPGRTAIEGQRRFAPVKGFGTYEAAAYAPELADKYLYNDEWGDMWLPSFTKYRYNQNIEKEEKKAKEAEEKQLKQMNDEGYFEENQLEDLNNMGNEVIGPEGILDMIVPMEKDTINIETDNLFGD